MNKVILIWNVVLTAALAYVLLSPANTATIAEEESTEVSNVVLDSLPDSVEFVKSKVVFINNDTLFSHFDMYEDLKGELEQETKRLERKFQTEYQKVEQDFIKFQESTWSMTNSQIEAGKIKFTNEQERLGRMEKNLTLQLANKEAELVNKIKDAIEKFCQSKQEEYGFDFVLSKSNIGGLHYANPSRDITQMVIVGMNAEYRAKKDVKKSDNP